MSSAKKIACAGTNALLIVLLMLATTAHAQSRLTAGKETLIFSEWDGPALKVHTYIPAAGTENAPLMIVMHGTRRNADDYRDQWIPVADKLGLIIAAPEFDAKRFPGSSGYNLGGATPQNPAGTAFKAIEPLFDNLRSRFALVRENYYIYGHSAGGQFVHRFVFANPKARIVRAFAANAGWYTMLSKTTPYPYGLKDAPFPKDTQKNAFNAPLVILLGDADTERGSNLRVTPQADAQGYNRLQRGLIFYSHAATSARQKKLSFGWRLSIVPETGHQNSKMAWGVAPFIEQ